MASRLVSCRAAGGFLLHLRPMHSDVALCGHEPYNNPRRRMRRARWMTTKQAYRNCEKCFKKAEQQGLELPAGVMK